MSETLQTQSAIDDTISPAFEQFKTLLFKMPDHNEIKVEFIKQELSSGRYEVKSEEIAEKLFHRFNTHTLECV